MGRIFVGGRDSGGTEGSSQYRREEFADCGWIHEGAIGRLVVLQ